MTEERNFNDKNEFVKSLIKCFKRFHYSIKRGRIFFSDKYDDDTRFSQIYTEDIKEEIREANNREKSN